MPAASLNGGNVPLRTHSIAGRIQVALFAVFAILSGCTVQTVSIFKLEMHQSQVNRTGLTAVHVNDLLQVTVATPVGWDLMPTRSNILYTHQQWRSPDKHVGMGVAYLHTPIAFSPQTLIWFAKAQYVSRTDGKGRLIAQWTDSLGRCWFEAENAIYHVRGYAMTRGNDAWIVYSGYRVQTHPSQGEIMLAQRGADSVAPLPASE
jgi:hypothetical protein